MGRPLISMGLLTAMPSLAAAAEESSAEIGAPHYPGAATLAVILTVAHILAPQIRRMLHGREMIVASLGGGMAVAYVFLHLLPELHVGHGLLGRMIFAVPLVGFLAQYLLKRRIDRVRAASYRSSMLFFAKLANLCVYNWLMIYGSPAKRAEVGWYSIPLFLAIVLHLVHGDYAFGEEEPRRFDSIGRWCLVLASLLGYLTIVVEQRTNEDLNTIFVALLAGSVLYNVFSEEVPDDRQVRFEWFLVGTLGFAAFVALSLDW